MMKVRLIAHTQLTQEFFNESGDGFHDDLNQLASDGKLVALTAIRSCYSANKPTEIVAMEGAKIDVLVANETDAVLFGRQSVQVRVIN